MRQAALPLGHELVVVNFAGGGGACSGIVQAIGRPIDIAINHDPEALAMHKANHPQTSHYPSDVFDVEPLKVTRGQPVGLAWFSPDCKHFSKAKGGKPVSKKIRGLAWVVIRWAKTVKPRVIMLENVEEFQDWGPLLTDGSPCKQRKGLTFRRWCAQLQNCGYKIEYRQLMACDYGAPTIRKRLFLIARCDGRPIVWPAPTHGNGRTPHRAAAECIEWKLPCPSIFEPGRDLVENTLRRIARGIRRYVMDDPNPFIVTQLGTSASHLDAASRSVDEPLRTVCASRGVHHSLVAATLINTRNGERLGQSPRVRDIREPYQTVTAQGSQGALVTAFLARHYGGHENDGQSLRLPMHTVTTKDHHALVYAFLLKYYGTDQNPRLDQPMHTVTTKDRFAIVMVRGESYYISDIGMRGLTPRELFRAQGFDDGYIIDPIYNGKRLTKTAQVRMAGNSVCPPVSAALVAANFQHEKLFQAAA